MKVFISWSGEPSRSVASALRRWLPLLIQDVQPWVSDEDIPSGTRWNEDIASELADTDIGIVCVTSANQSSPWLLFETGALAKRLPSARIVPIFVDVEPLEVTGPLAAFQGLPLDRNGLHRLVHDIAAASRRPLSTDALDRLFDMMWPELEDALDAAKRQSAGLPQSKRTLDEMVEELLERVRRIERNLPEVLQNFRPTANIIPGISTTPLPNAGRPGNLDSAIKAELLRAFSEDSAAVANQLQPSTEHESEKPRQSE